MISCTEFVLLYSELFKFIDKKEGKDGVMKYWEYISDTYVADLLGKAVEKEGLKGCWDYWSKSLNEEACDFKMTLDEENNDFSIYMSGCPSKKLINEQLKMVVKELDDILDPKERTDQRMKLIELLADVSEKMN